MTDCRQRYWLSFLHRVLGNQRRFISKTRNHEEGGSSRREAKRSSWRYLAPADDVGCYYDPRRVLIREDVWHQRSLDSHCNLIQFNSQILNINIHTIYASGRELNRFLIKTAGEGTCGTNDGRAGCRPKTWWRSAGLVAGHPAKQSPLRDAMREWRTGLHRQTCIDKIYKHVQRRSEHSRECVDWTV